MKYFFSTFFLLAMGFAKGQIVNIPDNNFKRCLISQGIDLNGDGIIQVTEALAVTQLNIQEGVTYTADHPVTNQVPKGLTASLKTKTLSP